MLSGQYRALDLTDLNGTFCGKMLAELGVDVVKVEPPAGSSERHKAPFFHDRPGDDRSLYWLAYNCNKRGITLNLETADGRAILCQLASTADFLIESFPPGYLARLGLGYDDLTVLNPRLIYTSITPFGSTGPRANWAASDLTILALGGMANISGDPDRAPLRFALEQSVTQAGAQAAAACLIALHHRSVSGQGQQVDVSMQEAICQTLQLQQQTWDIEHKIYHREGARSRRGNVAPQLIFEAKDGLISWRVFVASLGRRTRALVDWMVEEGMADSLEDVDWEAWDMNALDQQTVDAWDAAFARFFLTHTKAELHEQSLKRGLMLFPVNNALDLLDDRHLADRGFWAQVEHPELAASLPYPGLPYRSTIRLNETYRRAPLLGEHNSEVYRGELGLSDTELSKLKQAGVI